MPDLPGYIPQIDGAGGHEPGINQSTNNSWPVWGGVGLEPNTTVKFDIDGTEYHANVDEFGTWEFSPPEALSNGDHEFEMWAYNPTTGEESDRLEWETNVDADAASRARDAERVKDWKQTNADRFRELNRPQTGGGGGGGSGSGGSGSGGGGSGGSGGSGGGGFEKGSGAAVAVGVTSSSPRGLEKGNQVPDAAQ